MQGGGHQQHAEARSVYASMTVLAAQRKVQLLQLFRECAVNLAGPFPDISSGLTAARDAPAAQHAPGSELYMNTVKYKPAQGL